MSPETWGPPIWTLFHTLAEKINEDKFNIIAPELFFFIKKICANLPCPECSQHATSFLSKINFKGIRNKNDFRNMLYHFHNTVNYRKRKSLFKPENINKYSNFKLINTYNNFVSVYHTKGNMKLLAESFQRKLLLMEFKKWFMKNIINFTLV